MMTSYSSISTIASNYQYLQMNQENQQVTNGDSLDFPRVHLSISTRDMAKLRKSLLCPPNQPLNKLSYYKTLDQQGSSQKMQRKKRKSISSFSIKKYETGSEKQQTKPKRKLSQSRGKQQRDNQKEQKRPRKNSTKELLKQISKKLDNLIRVIDDRLPESLDRMLQAKLGQKLRTQIEKTKANRMQLIELGNQESIRFNRLKGKLSRRIEYVRTQQ